MIAISVTGAPDVQMAQPTQHPPSTPVVLLRSLLRNKYAVMSGKIDHLDASQAAIKGGIKELHERVNNKVKDLSERVDREVKDGGNMVDKKYEVLEKRYGEMDKRSREASTRTDRLFYLIVAGLTAALSKGGLDCYWSWKDRNRRDATET
ncbi:hypothetical protein HOY80DRAFT_1072482 [Tuber brumale]|nr:hypothetical protein HOY80DRAFT_1072482 [Tuber brumale]